MLRIASSVFSSQTFQSLGEGEEFLLPILLLLAKSLGQ